MMSLFAKICNQNPQGICPGGLPSGSVDANIQTILQIIFGIIGALAFLVIVIAGLRYVASAGDPQKTAQAKNTIIFALVGLVLAISAETIVAFLVRLT